MDDSKIDQMTGPEIAKRHKLEEEINKLLGEIDSDLKILSKELDHQKRKKGKYSNIKNKEDIMRNLEKKVEIIKNKYNSVENDEEELIDTFSTWEKKIQNLSQQGEERDLTDEEKNKIEEWKKKTKEQDEHLEEIRKMVSGMKDIALSIDHNIKSVEGKTRNLGGKIDKTNQKIKTQNERLKDLINQIRSSDKICCDIILILVFLGLVSVLYSLIKHKFIKK